MTSKRRRAYIGNLRPRPSLSQNLYTNLFVPHCLSVNNYPNGDGIQIVTPRNGSTVHAFVEFKDVDYAIQMLDGVKFDGKTLRVSREKSGFSGNRGGGGFGSAKWAGVGKTIRKSRQSVAHHETESGHETEGEIVERVRQVISKEISESSDPVASAIACTAAVSLMSSVDAFGLDDAGFAKDQSSRKESDIIVSDGDMSNQEFQTRCKLPLSELLNEYGEQELDWKKIKPSVVDTSEQTHAGDMSSADFMSRCKMPLSELMAEYGEQDVDWKKKQLQQQQQQPSTTSNKRNYAQSNNKQTYQNKNINNGMLAPFDKAFIHLELFSFGYKYGAPSHSKKGFTFAHPLPPLDCRDLDRAPVHVAKFTGLSYLVKKALLNSDQGGDDIEGKTRDTTEGVMRRKANEMADDIIKILVESIDEGGHGPISPLTMTISIGSEYGRHRAVVLVEHLAVVLRARLRRNDGKGYDDGTSSVAENGIVKQLVSVETRHRDIDARHKDEEAFGDDLKREVRAAEKAKRRQDREDDY
ncbi:hypothetical protein ACHAXN_007283, partial [Cyclotella atomus]